ncbi:tyrosine-type recombinase/integrase [Tunturibacter empetritectus]|uniref:Integrase n=1 Tax=Tunturiibacter lichenicola TaxID=2051959 RepID=A0A7W8J6Z6_9BACT|nr:tyrosine-type recombinase/integrase [Edaphobacter lichenicola]MBB5343808.1 integrase [Edaphobacter lichenicola]
MMKRKGSKATKKAAAISSQATARMTTKHPAQPRSTHRAYANSGKRYALSNDQLRHIFDLLEKDESMRDLREVAAIISNTGIRTGELCQLRWADVDVHRRRLILANTMSAFERYVPFGPKTLQVLEVRRERGPEAEYILGRSPRALLHRVSHQLRTVCDSIGVSEVTLHLLRRTFFARLVNSGASLDSCMIIGGWRSLSTMTRLIPGTEDWFKFAARNQARIEEEL